MKRERREYAYTELGGFVRLWFLWHHESRKRGWRHDFRYFASLVGESQLNCLRTLTGRRKKGYHTLDRLAGWASALTESWAEQGGPAVLIVLHPSGVIQPVLHVAGSLKDQQPTRSEYESMLDSVL